MTLDVFCRALEQSCGVAPGAHVLAAVSGGADSVAMLRLLCGARERMGLRLSAAHMEHGIRGEESLADMDFVRALCEKMNVPFYAGQVDAPAYARAQGCGIEAAARTLRYAFLEQTRSAVQADVIAVAHHCGDQAETVLMHAARGSDLRGLCAMRMRSGRLIRPLLGASAQELRAYLMQIDQSWREDATNACADYTRNAIRHQVMPPLEQVYPGAREALARIANCAQRDEDFFAQQIAALHLSILPLADGVAMARDALAPLHEALLSRVLLRLFSAAGAVPSHEVIMRITRALREGETSFAQDIDGECHVRLGRQYLCLTKPGLALPDTPLALDGETSTPFGVFSIRPARPGETGDGKLCQTIPRRLLVGAAVTARREGDAMIPFGQRAPVKTKKLMIDCGVERAMRRSVPVVRSGETILWLPGVRPSAACRAEEGESCCMVVLHPAPQIPVSYDEKKNHLWEDL